MSQKTVPAPFLTKTYELVDDLGTDDVVSWNESGTTFVVWKTADFARDLLPNYFKHNNFSSFVRQLNTYGFRKIVPDKWEFANEFFRRGKKELLAQMRRRKTVRPPPAQGQPGPGQPSLANSSDDLGSSSTSSSNSKSHGLVDTPSAAKLANLSDENEKLRKDNQTLSSELGQAKKRCDELIAFLGKYVNVGYDQINYIMGQGVSLSSHDGEVDELSLNENDNEENFEDGDGDDDAENLKLFGVLLKEKKKKRGRHEIKCFEGANMKGIKTVDTKSPWLQIPSCSSG